MKLTITFLIASFALACNNAGSPVPQSSNSTAAAPANDKPQTAIAHSLENQTPSTSAPTGEKSKWTQSGDPIDTKKFDTAIAAAEVAFRKSPNDAKAKKALAEAYLDRANALTGARQYASALGDYRRTVKNDPSNEEAKNWIDQIIGIYASMNRESPKEGEEPPPLPYKK
jgi:tetratricopeptide (TPR) repeat protein